MYVRCFLSIHVVCNVCLFVFLCVLFYFFFFVFYCFFFQAEDGIRDLVRSRGLGDVYKRQPLLGGLYQQTIFLKMHILAKVSRFHQIVSLLPG